MGIALLAELELRVIHNHPAFSSCGGQTAPGSHTVCYEAGYDRQSGLRAGENWPILRNLQRFSDILPLAIFSPDRRGDISLSQFFPQLDEGISRLGFLVVRHFAGVHAGRDVERDRCRAHRPRGKCPPGFS